MEQAGKRLLAFPLFQGMSNDELTSVLAHTKFGFVKYPEGKRIIKAGEACRHLLFLTHGKLKVTTSSISPNFSVEETITAPTIIQPECLFGLPQRLRSTFVALEPVNLITLDKKEVLSLCSKFLAFQLNLFNFMSAKCQRALLDPWDNHPATLRQHVANFLIRHCQMPTGKKIFNILMRQLANEINDSRLDVSKTLNEMEEEGLLILSRGKITVPAIERIIE